MTWCVSVLTLWMSLGQMVCFHRSPDRLPADGLSIQTLHEDSGEIAVAGWPGGAIVYQLTPLRHLGGSITVTLWRLDADETAGELLLIGAGPVPFAGPPAALVSGRRRGPRLYRVAAEEAHVAFVASNASSFRLTWQRNETNILDPRDDESLVDDSVLQSERICLFNASFMLEFEDAFPDAPSLMQLRDRLARIANDYAREQGMRLAAAVRRESVLLDCVSGVLPPRPGLWGGAVAVMARIVRRGDTRAPVFQRDQLRDILRRLALEVPAQVGRCPEESAAWGGAAACAPIAACAVLCCACWASRRGQKFRPDLRLDDERGGCNEYAPAPTKPQIRVTDEEGRHLPEDISTTLSEEDIEIFSRIRQVARRRSDLPGTFLESRLWQPSHISKIVGSSGTENVYDSLPSSIDIGQFEYSSVTKL